MTSTAGTTKLAAALAALALSAASCTSGDDGRAIASERTTTTASSSTTTSSTTTTVAPSTTRKPPPPGFGVGARGPEVRALEERLATLKYDVGKVDGVFDSAMTHAVIAFQKVEGMARNGRATPDVVARAATASAPATMIPGGGATHVEVDLKRQVLLLFKDNALYRVLSTSTGSGKKYCVDGECAKAVTPGGSFRVTRRLTGWRESRLGKLYNPLYFNGGIAIHGSSSVPTYPASHGCVRITMAASSWFPSVVPNGTPVYVIGGPNAPVPFNEPAPGEAPPNPPTTTVPPNTTTTQFFFPFPTTTTTQPPPTSTTFPQPEDPNPPAPDEPEPP